MHDLTKLSRSGRRSLMDSTSKWCLFSLDGLSAMLASLGTLAYQEQRNPFFFLCNLVDQLAYILLVARKSSQNEMTTPFVVQEEDNMLGGQLLRPEVESDQNGEGLQFTNCVLLSLRHQKAADGLLHCTTKPVCHAAGSIKQHSVHSPLPSSLLKLASV